MQHTSDLGLSVQPSPFDALSRVLKSVRSEAMPVTENVIASRSNLRVKQLRGAFAGQARLSGGLVAIEGNHLVEEALRSSMLLKTIFLAEHRTLPGYVPASIEVLRLSEEVFDSIMDTRSPQGIAALMVPPVSTIDKLLWGIPLILVAVGLQDPGNLGTIVRSAEAFGGSGVITTLGTVSPWNGKALRASVGSIFRLPVVSTELEDLRALQSRGMKLLAAVGEGVGSDQTVEVGDVDLTGSTAVMIGNEGAGLTPEWLEFADAQITIPCAGPVESLNAGVAASIILYEAHRQRARVGARP